MRSRFPGSGAAWSAWVADVEVNRLTGDVHVSRVVVGHDAGLMVNPAGVQHQIHGNVLQTTSRALKERARTDPASGAVTGLEWGSYPIPAFRDVPVAEVLTTARPGDSPLGAGESSSVPGTAAIANAIFDATGCGCASRRSRPRCARGARHRRARGATRGAAARAPADAGRAFETPFGTVYSTNLTPDANMGIGRWSRPASTRAMRHGISRDGRHL